MRNRQVGFTLMEMVGVVAVIAIIASMATPMIFDAIRNARMATFLSTIKTMRTAAARFYQDTGRMPVHIPSSQRDGEQLLMRNATSTPIPGWNGPYIESELTNPFVEDAWIGLRSGSETGQQFDLNGDGVLDTSNALFVTVEGASLEQARYLSDAIDSDGDELSGDAAWFASGRVKKWGGNQSSTVVLVYISDE